MFSAAAAARQRNLHRQFAPAERRLRFCDLCSLGADVLPQEGADRVLWDDLRAAVMKGPNEGKAGAETGRCGSNWRSRLSKGAARVSSNHNARRSGCEANICEDRLVFSGS